MSDTWTHKLDCDCGRCRHYRAENCRPGCSCPQCTKARDEGCACGSGCGCSKCSSGVGEVLARVAAGVLISAVTGIPTG